MYELYNARIVHCDLKPGNILVSADGHLSIADFGISMVDTIDDPDVPFEERTFLAYGGTHAYQAPELLITHDKANITCAADMWSFGAIVYEIYTGKRLFSAEVSDVKNEVWGWDIPAIVRREIDDTLLQDFVIQLLELDPKKRLKLNKLGEHPYFARTDWYRILDKDIKIALDEAELYSASWEEGLRFERPATPNAFYYEP